MSKKVLSIVLALALALSCFAVSAFAIGEIAYEEEGNTFKQEWSLSEAAQDTDGNWYVEVSLKAYDTALAEAYRVGAMQFKLDITGGITIADVVKGSALTDGYGADVAFDPTGKTNIVAIIPNPYEDASEALDLSNGGVVCTVYFTVADGASGTVQIVDDAKSATNPGGTLFAARMTDGVLASGTSVIGQITTIESEARTIGALPAADLVKKAAAEAGILIDKEHTFGGAYTGVVYGFTQAAANTFMSTTYLNNNLEASNGGSLAYSRSIGKSGYGTGTVITVKNADGTTAATYVVVIFGDVDGNGLTNVTDTKNTKTAASNKAYYADNSVQRMAANCQMVTAAAMMHTINTGDTKAVKGQAGTSKVDQAALAAKMASLTAYYK